MSNGTSSQQAARVLSALARSFESKADVDRRKKSQFHKFQIDSLRNVRFNRARSSAPDSELFTMSLVLAERALREMERSSEPANTRKAIVDFISALKTHVQIVRPQLSAQVRFLSGELARGLSNLPPWLSGYIKGNHPKPTVALYRDVLGSTEKNWREAIRIVNSLVAAQQTSTVDRLATEETSAEDISVAGRLSRLAESTESAAPGDVEYDASDKNVKLTRIRAAGFRGSPAAIEVDLTKGGKPVCVLLWGDNGTGKSTVVDSIEFATQGRVDRSADFNSSLRPSVQNIAASSAEAAVDFSDGTTACRTLERNKAGRYVASAGPVRPGFRIAPIAIRRADVLRFLDTQTLARGTVFFDYFPDPRGGIGYRPDEELRMLEEERFALRVARVDLARRLARRYSRSKYNLEHSDQFEKFVDEVVLADTAGLSVDDRWAAVDEDARADIGELRRVHRRSKAVKTKLGRGIEMLNPVANQAQLDRIRPVLESIGADLTNSFLSIARSTYVKNIRTLVGQSGPVSLDIVVELEGGQSAFPQQIFSEGNKDLIAFLFFLAVAKRAAESGQARVLVLDDVLQSVDATIRLDAMSHVLDEFKDWQLIVTGHDRGWHSQLRSLFNAKGLTFVDRVIGRWDFARGPLIHESAWNTVATLRDALDRGDDQAIAGAGGVLLEQICNELSWRLGTSVKRKKDDRYTLAELWDGLYSVLRKTAGAQPVVTELHRLIPLRNLVGAHYNFDAGSISSSDVRRLGDATLELFDLVFCETCESWIEKRGTTISCKKGHKVLTP